MSEFSRGVRRHPTFGWTEHQWLWLSKNLETPSHGDELGVIKAGYALLLQLLNFPCRFLFFFEALLFHHLVTFLFLLILLMACWSSRVWGLVPFNNSGKLLAVTLSKRTPPLLPPSPLLTHTFYSMSLFSTSLHTLSLWDTLWTTAWTLIIRSDGQKSLQACFCRFSLRTLRCFFMALFFPTMSYSFPYWICKKYLRPGLKFPVSQGHVPPNSLPRVIWITLVGTLATTHMGWLVAAAQSRPIQILLHPFTKPQQKLLRAPPLPCTCAPCLLPTGTGGRKLLEKHSGKNQLLLLPPPRTPLCFVSRSARASLHTSSGTGSDGFPIPHSVV